MKIFGYFLVVLLVLIVGGALIAPSFIDWNQYKTEIESQVLKATGRQLSIDGNISVTVLPAPALEVQNVRLSNAQGASAPNMVSLRSAVVKVALGPLIGGAVQVESFKLVEPVIEIEIMEDGRNNLDFNPPSTGGKARTSPSPAGAAPTSGQSASTDFPVRIDSFIVENGLVVYRDSASGTVEEISALNANVAAGSLIGPFDLSGGFVRGGLPLNFEVSVGKIIHERTVGFAANLSAGGQGKINLNGTAINTNEGPKVKGKFKAEGENLAKLVGYLTGGGTLPGILGQTFLAEGEVSADKTSAKIENGIVRLGSTQGEVSLEAGFAKEVDAALSLKLKHADANKWLELPPVKTEGAKLPEQVARVEKSDGTSKAMLTLQRPEKQPESSEAKSAQLPKNINAAIDISADTLVFMDDAIRDAKFSASLAGGEITLNQVSAALPGGTDLAAFGFVTNTEKGPRFEGSLEASASDLRGVLRWLRVDVPQIPRDRLRKMVITADLAATQEQLQVTNVKAGFDASKVTGGITVALRERPAFGADFTLDRLNLDAYMPQPLARGPQPKATKATSEKANDTTDKKDEGKNEQAINLFKPLAPLTLFDANVRLKIKDLTAQGLPAKNARLDATLFKNTLTLRDVGIDNLAGASISVKGELAKLEGIPQAKALKAHISAKNTARLFEFLGTPPPINPGKLGAIALAAHLDGSLMTPDFSAKLKAAGGEVDLQGKANPMNLITGLKVKTAVRHKNLAQLLKVFGLFPSPAAEGAVINLAAMVEGSAKKISVTDLTGELVGASVGGTLVADMAQAKPMITAKLDLGHLNADALLPASSAPDKKPAQKKPSSSATNSRYSEWQPGQGANDNRWSRAPLDLSALHQINADIGITAQSITLNKIKMANSQLVATLKDGQLDLTQLSGKVFDGQLSGKAQLSAASTNSFAGSLSLSGGNILTAVRTVTGKDLASGTLSFSSEVQSSGASVHDLVSQLGGKGKFALNKVDAKQDAQGTAMAGALDLVRALNGLGGALGGNKGKGLADITGSFTILKGVARSEDLNLVSNITKGSAKGTVDLPNWMVDTRGEVTMAQNLLTALLATKVKIPSKVPFTVIGPLDDPSVKLQTGSRPATTQQQNLQQNPVGTILQQIIPQKQDSQQQQQQPAPQKLKPEDIFKQLLRGGIR